MDKIIFMVTKQGLSHQILSYHSSSRKQQQKLFQSPFPFPLPHEESTLEFSYHEKFKDGKVVRTELMKWLINSILFQITLAD